MQNEVYMGVDVGTSGVRAAVYDEQGRRLALFYREYPLISDAEGKAELDPETVFSSLLEVIRACADGRRVAAVGLGAFMHGVMAADKYLRPLTGLMTWMDSRASPQAAQLARRGDIGALCAATGCRLQHPMYPLSKLLYLKQARPEVFARAARFLTMKQYLLSRLFGETLIDYADASATGLFDIHRFAWNGAIAGEILAIPEERLGTPAGPFTCLSGLSGGLSDAAGLPPDTPFYLGATDGLLAHIGSCGLGAGRMSSTVGTSGALRVAADAPPDDPERRLWCYALDRGAYVTGGAISNGGVVLKWIRDRLGAEAMDYAGLDALAASAPHGCEGLTVIPTFGPERNPDYNADTSAALHGLRLSHGKGHLVRAAMEGVMYRMAEVYEHMERSGAPCGEIVATGGYTKSEFWLQMQADIFGRRLIVPREREASVFGAAYLAMLGAKAVAPGQTLHAVQPEREIWPNPKNRDAYREGFARYRTLYRKLYGQV